MGARGRAAERAAVSRLGKPKLTPSVPTIYLPSVRNSPQPGAQHAPGVSSTAA